MPADLLRARPSLAFALLVGLLSVVCLAGGASRGDVLGQVVVRGASWIAVIVVLLALARPAAGGSRAIPALLLTAALVCLVQLVPLPPGWWQALPGRAIFVEAATVSGQAQSWRPWSIVPGATINAAASLIVPFAIWLLTAHLREAERRWMPGLVLAIVAVSACTGLLQLSGATINNPLINDAPGEVAGTFANRNHFALLLAMGCLIAPVWCFLRPRASQWRAPAAGGLVLIFVLMILASGSRAGLGLGLAALLIGLILSHRSMRKALDRYPRWVLPALIATVMGVVGTFVLVSVMADRAESLRRLFAVDQGQDMRGRGLPTVLRMIGENFPFGTGMGGFDPMFRLHEPFELLKPTYFNHAHNDFLEVALDAGLPGVLLLVAAVGWWAWASMRAWQGSTGPDKLLPRLGSAILFLAILASFVDYPVRTPMIMAVITIASMWLSNHSQHAEASALPRSA